MRRLAVAVAAVMLLATFAAGPATAKPSFTINWIEVKASASTPDYCEARVRVGWTSTGNGWKVVRIIWHNLSLGSEASFDYAPQIKTGTYETNVVFNGSANDLSTAHQNWQWSAEMIGGGGKILTTQSAGGAYQFPLTETCPAGGNLLAQYGTPTPG